MPELRRYLTDEDRALLQRLAAEGEAEPYRPDRKRAALRKALRQYRAERVTLQELADALGVKRQRVLQLVREPS